METKPVLQSKTMWFGFAVAALSILEAACGFLDEFLSPQYAALAMAVVGGIIMVLRVVTGMPIKRTKPKVPPVLLALVLALGVSGCAAFASIPWDKVIAAGGVLVEAGKEITPITCAGMERLGAPAADIARCKKADDIIKNTIGPLYGIGVGIAGTMATTTPVQVPGVGPVQVMALAPGLKPFKIGDKPRVIGFDTVQPVDSKPLEIK